MNRLIHRILLASCLLVPLHSMAHKPYNELQVHYVNLESYPKKITAQLPGVEVTIGDLHGNALKLVNFLISNGVLKIPKEDYALFVSLYKKNPSELTAKDLTFFHAIFNAAEINPAHKIRFLGDDLCDRGMNDYYTLMIYKKLDTARVPFEVVLSNHGNFFLAAYESQEQTFLENPYGAGQYESTVQSMLHMGALIEKGLIDKKELIDTIQNHYLKHIVLPGYIVNKEKNEITLYSHAPVDVTLLSALAQDLNLPFDDGNLYRLSKTLDTVNQQIHEWIMSNTFSKHYISLNEAHAKTNTPSPLQQVLWNRNYTILKRQYQPDNKPYTINYVHGHDSMPNVFDLDNLLGKGEEYYQGPYAIHVTHS